MLIFFVRPGEGEGDKFLVGLEEGVEWSSLVGDFYEGGSSGSSEWAVGYILEEKQEVVVLQTRAVKVKNEGCQRGHGQYQAQVCKG